MDIKGIKNLSDNELWVQTEQSVQKEGESTLRVLHYLREVERRRLFAARGYSSLHAFCIEKLKYSEPAAQRRIQSMRLLKDLPETEVLISEGKLNLTILSQAQNFFNAQAREDKSYSIPQKREIVERIQNKSKRDTEKFLLSLNPESHAVPKEKERVVSETHVELKIIADEELQSMMKRYRELTAHKNPSPKMAEVFKGALKIALDKLDPERRAMKIAKKTSKNLESSIEGGHPSTPPAERNAKRPYTSVHIEREVEKRDQYSCSFVDPISHKRCSSRFKLQFDHVIPFAAGGKASIENLRLRCAAHNQLHAIETFGIEKMSTYIST